MRTECAGIAAVAIFVLVAWVPGVQGQAAAPRQQFDEASIRPCDPDNIPEPPAGSRGGGANSFQMTPGRTHAVCMTLATIIRTAYGYGPADLDFLNAGRAGRGPTQFSVVYGLGVEDGVRVRGGPDWVRSDRYTIDAVADGAATAETMRGPMLRALLESRFKLSAHMDSEQVSAFALSIAKGGLKITPAQAGTCEQMPPPTPGQPYLFLPRGAAEVRRGAKPNCGVTGSMNGPNQVFVGGEATLGGLAGALASPLGGVQVFDRTGNSDKFNFILEFVRDENTPGPRFMKPRPVEPSDVPRGQTIFAALEEQIGAHLEPATAPREFIVIDHIERLSPN